MQLAAIADLHNDMKVKFKSKKGGMVFGVIKGLTANNKKSVLVVTKTGDEWKVSPQLLEIVE